MSEDKEKKSKPRRPRGLPALWLGTGLLSLIYFGIWSADRQPVNLPQKSAGTAAPAGSLDEATKQSLIEVTKQAAVTRSPGATIEVIQTEEAYFAPGNDLRKVPAGVGQRGLVITLGAIRDGKLTERLVYHALPPAQVVFISQQPAP